MRLRYLIAAVLAVAPSLAAAAETTTYSYDAKGRLTKVEHAGGPADRVTSTYTFDAADNRVTQMVEGAGYSSLGATGTMLLMAVPALLSPRR